jgi:aminomethyltransferase
MSEITNSVLQRTALFETHQNSGARLVPFAGWEMPVQYQGVKGEALAVRQSCGIFDVGHMGQFDFRGTGVVEALNAIVSADWSKVEIGRVAYGLLLNENGGIQDDVMGYRLAEDHWLVVVNAGRAVEDEAHIRRYLPDHITLTNRYADQSMIAVQGPKAEAVLQTLCEENLADFAWRDVREVTILGERGLLARGGYTGSDGFEWMGSASHAATVWQTLIEAGAVACGLGARDILRLEAGLPLYGHELREEWTPDMSGCAWAVKTEKGEFVGREAILKARQVPLEKRIRALRMTGKGIAREDYSVMKDGENIGIVTSGTLSPTLETGIALALLPIEIPVDSNVEISIRGAAHTAVVVKPPFVVHQTRTKTGS